MKIVKKSEKNTKIPQKNGKKYIIVMNTYKYIKLYLKQNNILKIASFSLTFTRGFPILYRLDCGDLPPRIA